MVRPTCTTANHIALHNITQEPETISYPLFLLKGRVEHPAPNQDHVHFTLRNVKSTAKPSKSGNFKHLLQLEQGQNIVTVQFCCSSSTVTLNYVPSLSDFSVAPLYVVCQGDEGRFQAPETEENSPKNACKRIATGAKLLQCLYAEKLNELGFERKTFRLDPCCVFKTKLRAEEARGMAQKDLWFSLAREIVRSDLGKHPTKKFLAFLSCTRYTGGGAAGDAYEDLLKATQGHVAFGGDGLALLGTGCLYTWPETVDEVARRFEDPTKVDRAKFLDDSGHRGDWGGCFATTLGAALHELSHTFDLGHTEEGIMGRGFDDIQNVFLPSPNEITGKSKYQYKAVDGVYWTESCATLLNYHRWLNSDFSSASNKKPLVLSFDKSTKVLRSTEGIRVVEVRRQEDELVVSSWVFNEKVLKYSFLVNFDDAAELMVVAEDNHGNILKFNLS